MGLGLDMKRDFDLIREIMFEIEKANPRFETDFLEGLRDKYGDDEINYQMLLLHDAGFIDAEINQHLNSPFPDIWQSVRMTWEGHEFLDAARDKEIWEKAKTKLAPIAGFTIEILKAVLIAGIKDQVGI